MATDKVTFDSYNSDLNCCIEDNGLVASTLNHPLGFRLFWAGVRATYGVSSGKVFFEVRIDQHLQSVDHNGLPEPHPHLVRVGWSMDGASFSLGQDAWSFGYGGTGKFSREGQFTDYGQPFGKGDVIAALLDLDSRPATISYLKNGRFLGIAFTFPPQNRAGNSRRALFPHVSIKNCKVRVNFGQCNPWFSPPQGYRYIGHLSVTQRIRGSLPPANRSKCEVIMLVGLPGSGKTTWAKERQTLEPEKRYNILGTDVLLDGMKVMGLSREYSQRWAHLIKLASVCLNSLFEIAASRARNYIIDQTNVFHSARDKKMRYFQEFRRIAVVIQPSDGELVRRSKKRTRETGKDVPVEEVQKMKANYSLPAGDDGIFHRVDFVELGRDEAEAVVDRYNSSSCRNPRYRR